MEARAYVYRGEWVADCVRPDCADTEFLFALRRPHLPVGPDNPRDVPRLLFRCSECNASAEISWPSQRFATAAMAVLHQRPVPGTRNWYPADHPVAVAFHVPHGQSIADLRAENEAHGVPDGRRART